MKIISKIALLLLMVGSSSCAMMLGDKNDSVSILSNPPGADIFIDGRNYGKTPATLDIEAKNHTVTLTKEGYGSTQLQLETWATIKNGACGADIFLGWILIYPLYNAMWSGDCGEFREDTYSAVIPQSASRSNNNNSGNQNRNYYYNQGQTNPNQNYYGQQYQY